MTVDGRRWGSFLRTTVGPFTKIRKLFHIIFCCRGRYDPLEVSESGNLIFRLNDGNFLVLTFEGGIFKLATRLHVDSVGFAYEIVFHNHVR
jgi:hypothetical protein